MSPKGPKKKGICVYCGKHKRTTIDHVPPSCLFSGPSSPAQIQVACCLDCLEELRFDMDDEYVCTIFHALSEETFNHPTIAEKRPKIMRSLKNEKKRGLWKHIIRNIHPVTIKRPSGLFAVRHVYKPDYRRIELICLRYLWAFNTHLRTKPIRKCHSIAVFIPETFNTKEREALEAKFKPVLNLDPVLESPEFCVRLMEDEFDEDHTMWVFTFYEAHNFYCEIYPRPEVSNENIF